MSASVRTVKAQDLYSLNRLDLYKCISNSVAIRSLHVGANYLRRNRDVTPDSLRSVEETIYERVQQISSRAVYALTTVFCCGLSIFSRRFENIALDLIASREDALSLEKRRLVSTSNNVSAKAIKVFGNTLNIDNFKGFEADADSIRGSLLESEALVGNEVDLSRLDASEGICNWFLKLYFETFGRFDNFQAQLMCIAKIFQNGAPIEALICKLFTLFNYPNKIYDNFSLKKIRYEISSQVPTFLRIEREIDKQKIFLKQIEKHFLNENISNKVVYSIMLTSASHSGSKRILLFLDKENCSAFIFRPDRGLYQIKGPHLDREVARILREMAREHYGTDEILYIFSQITKP